MTPAAQRGGRVADAIARHRLVAVLRRVEPRDRLLDLVEELAGAGVRAFEITMDAPEAADDLASVRERLTRSLGQDGLVGAGTVTTRERLDAAAAAGADFAVAPHLDPAIVAAAAELDMPFIPGALTPTEIAGAWSAGATFVKLFPASAVGPAFVRELRGPMPDVRLIPTGGIDAKSALEFLGAGAAAVGIGGALTRATPAERRELVRRVLEAVS
jgi:2-dehydro-3-deoxyphosphogluconate aldolase / (4S)-4-hydroxy-2-oxoglutarate aldolase